MMSSEVLVTEFPYPGELAVCGGGKPVDECKVTEDLEKGLELYPPKRHHSEIQSGASNEEDFTYRSVQAYFPLGCIACGQMCEAVSEVINGQRTAKRPAVFSMDPDTYRRVRPAAFGNLSWHLLSSLTTMKEEARIQLHKEILERFRG